MNRAKSLLAGIAECQSCGRGLVESATGSRRKDGTRSRSYKCPATSRKCSSRAQIPADELNAYVEAAIVDWLGPYGDELVELELELGARGDRVVAEHHLAEAERVALEYEANVELELELGSEKYAAGRKARAELVERRRRELEALGEADAVEVVRATLREAMSSESELDVDERRRLYSVALDRVVVRRTPRRGAPVVERARLFFASAAKSPSSEDARELGAEAREETRVGSH